jgi:hypothetical protein
MSFCSTNWPLVEQKLMLSYRFSCDRILNKHIYDFGHTLLRSLCPTSLFNKPASDSSVATTMSLTPSGTY